MGVRLADEGRDLLHRTAARHVGDDAGDDLVPGLVALVAAGDDVHVEALGALAVGGAPMARDTMFRISSTTKPMTAAVTMTLVDDGLVDLDEPVDRLLPELAGRRVLCHPDGPLDDTVPARRPITARDLLTFTFGFGLAGEMFTAAAPWPVVEAADRLRLATFGPPDPATPPAADEWIARLGSLPLITQPGERWLYNTGASVLGVLVQRAARAPFAEVLRARLFDPLGMHDTAFWAPGPGRLRRLATAYRPEPAGLVAWDEPAGSAWGRPPEFCDGAGGLLSTADDLLAFARMFLDGGAPVLSASSVRAMTTGQLTAGQRSRGGLLPGDFDDQSWSFGQAVHDSGAFGWDGGLGSSWLVDPARELTVIVLTQRMFGDSGLPDVHAEIRRAARAALA
ncbi:serine hydrolase [Parafrankia sp. BMG5.11]|uniref:serine hydrolase domain-containing protein n=1 Tax=Parafrankia sp. BMG5.11 TaxID=222540 RepID=UPI000DA55036|nr:serine hydrolase domain-containing protein [Parafrankia sp. BMG5.11]SQD99958.1 Beta-lactamase [Parafrankia sp. Ea1.12]